MLGDVEGIRLSLSKEKRESASAASFSKKQKKNTPLHFHCLEAPQRRAFSSRVLSLSSFVLCVKKQRLLLYTLRETKSELAPRDETKMTTAAASAAAVIAGGGVVPNGQPPSAPAAAVQVIEDSDDEDDGVAQPPKLYPVSFGGAKKGKKRKLARVLMMPIVY